MTDQQLRLRSLENSRLAAQNELRKHRDRFRSESDHDLVRRDIQATTSRLKTLETEIQKIRNELHHGASSTPKTDLSGDQIQQQLAAAENEYRASGSRDAAQTANRLRRQLRAAKATA